MQRIVKMYGLRVNFCRWSMLGRSGSRILLRHHLLSSKNHPMDLAISCQMCWVPPSAGTWTINLATSKHRILVISLYRIQVQDTTPVMIIEMKVYYNGTVVSNASPHSFKDLGCGYAKDSYRVYYCGKKLTDNPSRFTALTDGYAMDSFDVYYFGKKIEASTAGFKVLSDGYAKDAFDAYYCGKEVVGSSASTFKVTGNGYAKDNWETYYLGKKVR